MISFRPACAILLAALLTPALAAAQSGTIKGTVLSAETGAPIPGANVFIATTIMGAATAGEGSFRIEGVPPGSYDLIASFVGFQPATKRVRITGGETIQLTFSLPSHVMEAGALTVSADASEDHFRVFRRFFLGVSRNASLCTILNPEVLRYQFDEETGVLNVTAVEPLKIENRALGYVVTFLLDEFRLQESERRVQYSGLTGFTELQPDGARERRRWRRRRERAYNGSVRHFLTALSANRLQQEGFMLVDETRGQEQALYGVPGSRPSRRVYEVSPADILTDAELEFERVLSFSGYLKVLYFNEVPDRAYLDYREYMDRGLRASEDAQVSWISLNQPSVTITTDGSVVDTYSLTRYGFWFFERIAELVPMEYAPDGIANERRLALGRTVGPGGVDEALSHGLAAFENGDFPGTIDKLAPIHESGRTVVLSGGQSSSYLLGVAYARSGRPADALSVWRDGLIQTSGFDVLMADAFIKAAMTERREDLYLQATQTYLTLLERADDPAADDDARRILNRHAAQVLLLLQPDSARTFLSGPPGPVNQSFELEDGAGTRLSEWWRERDPLPASALNERLAEHLARVAYAEANYGFNGDLLAFDDRGKVYVRFGAPNNAVPIAVNFAEATAVLRRNSYVLPGPIVPITNEFWTYRHVDDLVYYFFILEGGRYQQGLAEDLIPDALQSAFRRRGQGHGDTRTPGNPSGEQVPADQAYAEALVASWRSLYTELAAYHPDFEAQLTELDLADSDVRATQLGGSTYSASALSYVNSLQARYRSMGIETNRQRDREAPRSYSRVEAAIVPFQVTMRTARFLEPDGRTRLELYWMHEPESLPPGRRIRNLVLDQGEAIPDRFLLDMVITLRSTDGRRHDRTKLSYLALASDRESRLPGQAAEIVGINAGQSVLVQWDQYLVDTLGVERGRYLRTAVRSTRVLEELRTSRDGLEMSDLRPIIASASASASADADPLLYPSGTIVEDVPLGLHFEIYHLRFGANDRTQYSIEYEVIRNVGRRSESARSARISTSGTTSTARETIAVELQKSGGSRNLEIRVHVTDEVSGEVVSRALRFPPRSS